MAPSSVHKAIHRQLAFLLQHEKEIRENERHDG